MAEKRIEYFKLFAPGGTEVEVAGKERAEVLKSRGYTTSKPRNVPRLGNTKAADDSSRVAELEAQLAKAQADLEAATAPAQK